MLLFVLIVQFLFLFLFLLLLLYTCRAVAFVDILKKGSGCGCCCGCWLCLIVVVVLVVVTVVDALSFGAVSVVVRRHHCNLCHHCCPRCQVDLVIHGVAVVVFAAHCSCNCCVCYRCGDAYSRRCCCGCRVRGYTWWPSPCCCYF